MTTGTPQAIKMAFDLAKPPATVWRTLTESELLARWLMPNDFKPIVGHRFTMQGKPNPHWDGTVHCEVLVVEEPSKLSHTWCGGGLETVLTWTLDPSASGGTILHLDHDGFLPKDAMAFKGIGDGWGKLGERLASVLATL
ncbi:MAG: Activator of Hsp90 ATPase 1 family protein [Cyanobacteria bacterium RYN_339]|nr:Activator of Hsp90 ATPase 1 family protein [Cyanobacteria bacterium RYN_339]